ncbi:MAG: hypothetical protein GQ570_11785 [Helicobacteraceae bacterium]|nr:hypothetical protein [Helicobacteraceae bacterium]
MLIEDGTGLALADTYADVAFVDAYFLKRNETSWTGSNTEKEAYIYKAMDYIEAVYGQNWVGTTLNDTQGLTMPRLYNSQTIYPLALQNAVCLMAMEVLHLGDNEKLMINVSQRVKKEKVASIEVEYSEYSSELTQYTEVYQLLSPYLESGSTYQHGVTR